MLILTFPPIHKQVLILYVRPQPIPYPTTTQNLHPSYSHKKLHDQGQGKESLAGIKTRPNFNKCHIKQSTKVRPRLITIYSQSPRSKPSV